jgi:hypothetical protein
MCADDTERSRPLVVDLYCGAGGVGIALEEADVRHVGVDVEDYSELYPGEFIQADASQPPLDVDADLVWASPPCQAYSSLSVAHYGSVEAAREVHPTIPELDVREVCQSLTAEDGHYIIENVKRCEHLREPAEINGYGVGLPLSNPRLFETSFPVPDAVGDGHGAPSAGGPTSESVALRDAKDLPEYITGNDINQAIPPRMVQYLLHYCPSVPDVDLPDAVESRQSLLGGGFVPVADGGETADIASTDTERSADAEEHIDDGGSDR